MDPQTPSIEILTFVETTPVLTMEEAGAQIEVEIERLGPYQLGECIGRGGMAVVCKAKMVGPFGFEKQLVVKRLHSALMQRREFFELFTQEARITAQLGHPGIVQVHDFGVSDGAPFLVMEFLDGVNLSQVVKRLDGARLPIDVVVIIVTQLCHALGYAHAFRDSSGVRRQVVHGDVSPSNLMVCRDGTAKLLDFGVAKLLGEFDFELPPMLTGKSAYMAPEQLRREPFDRRVDVFAAGIVLHELLTGRRLFAARNDVETLHRVLEAKVDRPSRSNPAVPRALDEVAMRALKADPGARFDSGEEMARALESACRVAGGRRRVAEYLEALFAHPGESGSSDGTQLTALDTTPSPLPPPPSPLSDLSSLPSDLSSLPVAAPFRPRSITEMVRPLAPSRRAPPAWSRQLLPLTIFSSLVGFGLTALGPRLLTGARHQPAPLVAPIRPHHASRHFAFHKAGLSPTPPAALVVVEPPAAAARHHARHTSASPTTPAAPAPTTPAAPAPTTPAAPAPPPTPPTVKDGRLLDPFTPVER